MILFDMYDSNNQSIRAHADRYPRWGDEIEAGDKTNTAPTDDDTSPPSVPADTKRIKSQDDEKGRQMKRKLASTDFDASNLSESVQKLLQDFATDSDELAKSDSSLPLAKENAPSLPNVSLTYEDESGDADSGTGVSSQLATMPVSIINTLPLKADVAQVIIDCDFLLNFLPVLCCLHTVF